MKTGIESEEYPTGLRKITKRHNCDTEGKIRDLVEAIDSKKDPQDKSDPMSGTLNVPRGRKRPTGRSTFSDPTSRDDLGLPVEADIRSNNSNSNSLLEFPSTQINSAVADLSTSR